MLFRVKEFVKCKVTSNGIGEYTKHIGTTEAEATLQTINAF